MSRKMSLTPELVATCERKVADSPTNTRFTSIKSVELDRLTNDLQKGIDDQGLWLFAYGSLIWSPNFDYVDPRRGTIYGWHRAFCLELTRWRGTPEQPGLMMALERGGCCTGVVYRLPEGKHGGHIRRLVEREITVREDLGMVRWSIVHTDTGPIRALVFWAGPEGEGISLKLPLKRVAWILARACGTAGSCASYLYNTVAKLQEYDMHDRNLWRLQELVAKEIRVISQLNSQENKD
jgi:cation transport protein ChaC